MIGVDLITELANSIFLTGSLKTDPPQSLMLISSPESGKTSIVERKDARSILFFTDIIGTGMLDELKQKGYVTHFVIRDMVMVMAHKAETNQRTIATIMALTEDGLGRVNLGRNVELDFGKRRAGIVCCITSDVVNDQRRWWNSSGFASRLIPFNYEYSRALQVAIITQTVINGAYETRKNGTSIVVPSNHKEVLIPPEIASRVQSVADLVARNLDEKGIRRGKQFRALARGHALLNRRLIVDLEDIQFLRRLAPFISYSQSKEIRYVKTPNRAPELDRASNARA